MGLFNSSDDKGDRGVTIICGACLFMRRYVRMHVHEVTSPSF